MKRFSTMLLSVVLSIGLLAGCGKDYKVQESTVFILKNGDIVSTDVEEFADTYDKAALETYINDAIKVYADENGSDAVELSELTVENGKATLIMEYASAKDYSDFNGIDLFAGTVGEALAAGYTFDVALASIEDGKATACTKDEIIDSSDLKVVVYKGTGNINVSGKILYSSVENVKYIDKNTMSVGNGNNLLNEELEKTTENVQSADDTQITETESVDEGSIDTDDLLEESTQEQEVEFDFGEETTVEENSDFSEVYTYIVYK